jgi:L,D-transpeptidase YbiS
VRVSFISFLSVAALSALVIGWSELYLPVRESLGTDVLKLAARLTELRRQRRELETAIPAAQAEVAALRRGVTGLTGRFPSAFSNDLFLVVNTAANRLFLRRGSTVLREAVISTGSNDTLVSGARKWIFETPRGVRTVVRRKADPVWTKPDWAFLEAGETIPAWDSPLRRQRGVLGAFLLDLGGGVGIHGTDKEHLLGRSVTHGCIRVGRDDIKFLYDSVPTGAKVYIY